MINIRPVSDLRNNFREIEESVKSGKPVYLTKDTEPKLDEADKAAEVSPVRHTHEEVFARVRKRIRA